MSAVARPHTVTEDRHAAKVARLVAQIEARPGTTPLSLRKSSVSHQVPKAKDLRHRDDKVDISDLTEVIEIDPVRRICVAESGVTFVDLVAATLRHGLVPVVVPELKTITVGGAVAGCSLESMSFARGGFHDTCVELEVVTSDGRVLVCTRDNDHRLVFDMLHGAFGTLGIITRLTFELVPAKPYVHLVYERHRTLADYQAAIRRHADAHDVDFIDGIIHSPTCYALCLGRFVDTAPYVHRYDWVRVYYKSTRVRDDDYLRTADYLFRYDRGVTNVRPKSLIGRIALGKFMTSSRWLALGRRLRWLLRSRNPTVTIDLFIPMSRVAEFLTWYEREFGFYPLWCVPYRRVRDYPWLVDEYWSTLQDDMFLDLAIYGMRQRGDGNVYRRIEDKLRELGGIKTLISHNYYSRDEFWSIWNKPNYEAVKRITDPNNRFRDLYTKTCKTVMGER
jgi:FAD/FMN-containing dehydrogenase